MSHSVWVNRLTHTELSKIMNSVDLAEHPVLLYLICFAFFGGQAIALNAGIKAILAYFSPEAVDNRQLHNEFARSLGYKNYRQYLKVSAQNGDCDAGIDAKDGFGVWLHERECRWRNEERQEEIRQEQLPAGGSDLISG